MPTYNAVCRECNEVHEYYSSIAECHATPYCCGNRTEKRILTAPAGFADIPSYESPASGKWITSRAERREDFKRTNTREWEGMASEKYESARQMKYKEEAQDKALDHTVRKAFAELPPSKKKSILELK